MDEGKKDGKYRTVGADAKNIRESNCKTWKKRVKKRKVFNGILQLNAFDIFFSPFIPFPT